MNRSLFHTVSMLLLLLSLSNVALAQKSIHVKNPSNYSRVDVVSIPFARFSAHFDVDTVFSIVDAHGDTYTHQLEKFGSTVPQNVLILVELGPKESKRLLVTPDMPLAFVHKTYARYVPERFDDFAWENDVVAFRLYGKALEGRADDAQGMDYWAKKTDKLVLNDWYKTDDYHEDHGEGLDYYSVGQTLGAGDIALYTDSGIVFTKHYRVHEILENGPIRTTFVLHYEPEMIQDQEVQLSKMITIDAGSHFNKIDIALQNKSRPNTDIALGLAKRSADSPPEYQLGKANRHLAYWEPKHERYGHTGVAIILPAGRARFVDENSQFLLVRSLTKNRSLTYYNGASWSGAGKINTAADWYQAVQQQEENIKKPIKTTLK